MNVLLVEPNFPFPSKSKHGANEVHKNFVPIGLLKLGAFHKAKGNQVKLVRGKEVLNKTNFKPDVILITTLFTYWSQLVWETVNYYRENYPKSKIILGGIYATLHKNTEQFNKLAKKYNVETHIGVHEQAEEYLPDYSLLSKDIEYHAMHAMRGCIRKCDFCGTWRIEPKLKYKTTDRVINEITNVGKNKVIFYDNNFLANPNRKEILKALAKLRVNGKAVTFECQSGFDGRLLEVDPELAKLLKCARFDNVRIAWDNGIKDAPSIKKQLDHFAQAGYNYKDIAVFMIYNFDIPLKDMILKQKYCLKWGVQISDCRNRPLTITEDNYKPSMWRKGQTSKDYYIHEKAGWTDKKIRLFRNIVRIHGITIRYAKDKNKNFSKIVQQYWKIKDPEECLEFMKKKVGYNKDMEKWSSFHNSYKFFELGRPPQYKEIIKNKALLERLKLLNQARNICLKKKIDPPKLDKIPNNKVNKSLRNFIEVNNISV